MNMMMQKLTLNDPETKSDEGIAKKLS